MGLIITAPTYVQVLEEYWKEWKINKGINIVPVRFRFSDEKNVQGVLTSQFGGGWEASLMGADMVRELDWYERSVVSYDLMSCDCMSSRCVVMKLPMVATKRVTKRNWKVKCLCTSTLRLFPLL